jgi:hypothetical protein
MLPLSFLRYHVVEHSFDRLVLMGPSIIEQLEELVDSGHVSFRLKLEHPRQLTAHAHRTGPRVARITTGGAQPHGEAKRTTPTSGAGKRAPSPLAQRRLAGLGWGQPVSVTAAPT